MTVQTSHQLSSAHCAPCEGGVEPFSTRESHEQLEALHGWKLTDDGRGICKDWRMKDFVAGMAYLTQVAELAEQEGHHPDLHLEGYRHVRIELSTHSIGGLSENDFIMAAKIDALPAIVKT